MRLRVLLVALACALAAFSASAELFISEYIEGSSNNKAIEIYNPSASAVNLGSGGYVLRFYFNGNTTSTFSVTLSGTIAANGTWVVAPTNANATILGVANQTSGSSWFNGDDALVLYKGSDPIDSFGQVGLDPGSEWGTGLASTADNTLRRKAGVCSGDATYSDVFTPATEWDGYATDTFNGLGAHAGCGFGISDASMLEGDSGTTNLVFNVTMTTPAGVGGVTFKATTADVSASAGSDYTALTAASYSIAEGATSTTVSVSVAGDLDPESAETFTVTLSDLVGTDPGDMTATGTIRNDDFTELDIHDIQGNGDESPYTGQQVNTTGIVTAVKWDGFFIQNPDAAVDADPNTSEGVFVYTSSHPDAAIARGDEVKLVGVTVAEYVPSADPLQEPLTELVSMVAFKELSSGNPLPAAVELAPDPESAYNQFEKYEGMRVSVAALTVTSPTDGKTDEPNAETDYSYGLFAGVVPDTDRPFREPGIQPPTDEPSPIPVWDGNLEIIPVDSEAQDGTTAVDVSTGAVVTGIVGVLDFRYRRYTVLTDPGSPAGVTPGMEPVDVTAANGAEFTVASFNLQRFYDTTNDAGSDTVLTATAYERRLKKASDAIRHYLHNPDIIGVVEAETLAGLQVLADRISSDALAAGEEDPLYDAYLIDGNDVGGIDVGFLVKKALVDGATPRVTIAGDAAQQFNKDEKWTDPADSVLKNLNDRPPLLIEATVHDANGSSFDVTVIANHLKALSGIDDPDPAEGARNRMKRLLQAKSLASLVQTRQTNDPDERIVLVGDFNAFEFNDGYGDQMGMIIGNPAPENETVVDEFAVLGLTGPALDLVDPDLTILGATDPEQRYSYVYDHNAQSLDHVVANQALLDGTSTYRVEHPRINADFPEMARNSETATRLSDHDPIVAYFTVPEFGSYNLRVEITSDGTARPPSSPITFQVRVTNDGPDPAPDATLSVNLNGSIFQSLTGPEDWTCQTPAVGSTGTITCDHPAFGPGTALFSIDALTPAVYGDAPVQATVGAGGEEVSAGDEGDAYALQVGMTDIPLASREVLLLLALMLAAAGVVVQRFR